MDGSGVERIAIMKMRSEVKRAFHTVNYPNDIPRNRDRRSDLAISRLVRRDSRHQGLRRMLMLGSHLTTVKEFLILRTQFRRQVDRCHREPRFFMFECYRDFAFVNYFVDIPVLLNERTGWAG